MRIPWLIIGIVLGLIAYGLWEPGPHAENRKLYPAEIYVYFPIYFALAGIVVGLAMDAVVTFLRKSGKTPSAAAQRRAWYLVVALLLGVILGDMVAPEDRRLSRAQFTLAGGTIGLVCGLCLEIYNRRDTRP